VYLLILLILPAWFAALFIFRRVFSDWRESALAASVAWGIIVVAMTEGLSAFHALAFAPLLVFWGLISCASFAVCLRLWPRGAISKGTVARLFRRGASVPGVLVIGICLIILTTLVIALVAPPNTWDSMTYHMARVANWVDHRSVRDYPTHIIRQLYLGPWAEFAITHLQILSGGDRFANCVQFLAMLGSVFGVSLLAKKLGASIQAQLFASVFCATIPMGVLQASSTQTDYVTAFWLLAFLNFTIGLVDASLPGTAAQAALAGASLGLAALTKMTALVIAAPFLLWLTFVLIGRRRAKAALLLGIMAAVALAMNAGHLLRNQLAFGWPLGPRAEAAMYANEIHTPAALGSNVIRNLAANLGTPLGTEGILGEGIFAALMQIHNWTGLDVNDRRTTFLDTQFGYSFSLNEDYAGNPVHLVLAGFAMLAAWWGFRRNRCAAVYSACLLGAFLVFCGYLKWQPWISRLQLPLFVAAAPVFGLFLSRDSLRRVAPLVAGLLLFVGALYATEGEVRPLVGRATILNRPRTDLYFAVRSNLREPFIAAAAELARGGATTVGIISGINDWEYPLRLLVRMRRGSDVQFEHINVRNPSRDCEADLPADPGLPDKIVVIGAFDPKDMPAGYRPSYASDAIRVFERSDGQSSVGPDTSLTRADQTAQP
jgi:hypothetical protein